MFEGGHGDWSGRYGQAWERAVGNKVRELRESQVMLGFWLVIKTLSSLLVKWGPIEGFEQRRDMI